MKNDTTFVCMHSGGQRGEGKMSKKRHLASSNSSFYQRAIDKNGFRRIKEGEIYKPRLKIFIFVPGLSYDLSKFRDNFALFRGVTREGHQGHAHPPPPPKKKFDFSFQRERGEIIASQRRLLIAGLEDPKIAFASCFNLTLYRLAIQKSVASDR